VACVCLVYYQIPLTPSVSTECRDLLTSLLQRNPADRLSFERFFTHPFVDLEHKPSSTCLPKAVNRKRFRGWGAGCSQSCLHCAIPIVHISLFSRLLSQLVHLKIDEKKPYAWSALISVLTAVRGEYVEDSIVGRRLTRILYLICRIFVNLFVKFVNLFVEYLWIYLWNILWNICEICVYLWIYLWNICAFICEIICRIFVNIVFNYL